ncbi:hypothetical protein, partial [Pseudomonas amygdali]|uniref:hypothetical protein n=1 Tax=Pseudomonas amygdali TaxID=47877 RepID=UPI001F24DA90
NAHGEGGWLKELSVPRVGTVGYFCSASLSLRFEYFLAFRAGVVALVMRKAQTMNRYAICT